MLGDCLLVFGGYNDEYYNDFSFIKLQKKVSITPAEELENINSAIEYELALSSC